MVDQAPRLLAAPTNALDMDRIRMARTRRIAIHQVADRAIEIGARFGRGLSMHAAHSFRIHAMVKERSSRGNWNKNHFG